jgi:UDP-N-acetylmuramate: L-alanyl-gamma-D-glutamyl-meso-diaminopimelate ligase
VLRARGEPHAFDVLRGAMRIGRVEWNLLGEHNQLNALAAIAAAEHIGVSPDQAARSLGSFANVRRRLELRGEVAGIRVYDDFAHHPTAMRVTLDGLRRKLDQSDAANDPQRPLVLAVFEPRSNTMRLGRMKEQLPWALEAADRSFCLQGNYGWSASEALAPLGKAALVVESVDALVATLVREARAGDHIVCMSNGSFGNIHDKLLKTLAARAS